MFKDFLLVGFGSFFGGGLRFLVSRLLAVSCNSTFPFGTFTVNVLGCFIIGFISSLSMNNWLTPNTRLLLTTGFCGGFTTFSTFMKENAAMMKDGMPTTALLYTLASLVLGFVALIIGQQLARVF